MAYYTSTWSAPAPTKEWAPNPCPTCGGLECLCRPRFFAGQLLTEEDLNRLEHYVIEKNKLHNRYLHGWGTVCGLEVICSPCAGQVTVTSGYALSPCGEDILVCKDDTVNVCDLIKACKHKQRRQLDCEATSFGNGNDCKDVPEDWILAIRYDEKPSRGITALRGSTSSPCCSRCSCGGSSSCGCSCHAQTNSTMKNGRASSQKTVSAQCEPTVTCEGYVYEVYKAPKLPVQPDCGPFIDRICACLKDFEEVVSSLSVNKNAATIAMTEGNVQRLSAWLRSLKSSLQDLLEILPIYECGLAKQLASIALPNPGTNEANAFMTEFATAASRLVDFWVQIPLYCLCSAILPPCPDPLHDPRVPLATITVSTGDCKLVRVCNLDTRKFVLTFPNLLYWLSPVLQPFLQFLHCLVESICCKQLNPSASVGVRDNRLFASISAETFMAITANDCLAILEANNCLGILGQILTTLNKSRAVDPRTLVLGTLGLKDVQGAPVMSELELNNPCAFLLLNQLVRPLLSSILPEQVAQIFAAAGPGEAPAPAAGRDEEINILKTQLADLQKTMQAQQAQINALSKK